MSPVSLPYSLSGLMIYPGKTCHDRLSLARELDPSWPGAKETNLRNWHPPGFPQLRLRDGVLAPRSPGAIDASYSSNKADGVLGDSSSPELRIIHVCSVADPQLSPTLPSL